MIEKPILLETPLPIRTPRLVLTLASPERLNELAEKFYLARAESLPELKEWMLWAGDKTDVDDHKERLTRWYAHAVLREEFCLLALTHEGEFVAACGIHDINWKIPRGHIGYWVRTSMTGKGYATELANALTRYAFDVLKLRKVTIDVDKENTRSAAVAMKLGFAHDYDDLGGITKPDTTELRTRRIYARYNPDDLLPLDVSWGE